MDTALQEKLSAAASSYGIDTDATFTARIDKYIADHFLSSSSENQRIIQTVLGDLALRIAKTDGKVYVQQDDVKAAIWFLHLPIDPDDTCRKAGEYILQNQSQFVQRLSPELRSFLGTAEGGAVAS